MNEQKMQVVSFLKNKISSCSHEELHMKSLRHLKSYHFTIASDGTGLQVEQLPNFILKWEHFQKIVERANQLGGTMYRGDQFPQNGSKLGSEIPHDCMEGFIAGELLNAADGTTVTRRSTYYSGILAWAGIITLHKNEGNGSYITVNSEFRNI
jgi:hypothetical protein